ncbi:MAG: hypothetical protein IJD17_02825 [Clostridia bacterium]|nr:hypothetical protein [Clostridia bacterium]
MLKFIKSNSYNILMLFLTQIAMAVFALVMSMWTSGISPTIFLAVGIFGAGLYVYIVYLKMREVGADDRPAVVGNRASADLLKGLKITLCANALNILCGVMVFVFAFFLVYQQPVKVVDESGEPVELYYTVPGDETLYPTTGLYSDSGDDVYTFDNGKRLVTLKTRYAAGVSLTPCDPDGNELELYSLSGDTVNTERNAVDTWASDLYGVPMVTATFIESMYKAIHVSVFGNADWFYLVMPIPAIIAGALGYYMALNGKRILFFLPELKESKRKRARY